MTTLLTLAGRKFDNGSYTGGAVVQLGADGTWRELAESVTVYWRLKNFSNGTVHTLWHIRSNGFAPLSTPDNGALHRSVDQGASWTDVTPNDSLDGEFARDIAQDANGDLWLITDNRERPDDPTATGKPSFVYKSTDDGVTWTLKFTTVNAGLNRHFKMFNITCHPTDADIVLVEGQNPVSGAVRIWKTINGGTSFTSTDQADLDLPSPPDQFVNTGGAKMHIFNYLATGDVVWAGIFETDNSDFFILQSQDDGFTWTNFHNETSDTAPGTAFLEKTLAYFVSQKELLSAATDLSSGVTTVADIDDSPFETDNDFHDLDRIVINSVDTLHLGVNVDSPNPTVTLDPSVFTRPADLSSDWVEHFAFDTMDSDLGYRLYVAIDGLIGATEDEADEEPVRPPRADEPPGGGGPSGDPAIGEARLPKREPVKRRGLRGRRGVPQPIGTRGKLPPVQGEQIDKRIPPEFKQPLVRKWLDFGWLVRPMLEGQKTITLRDWGTIEGVQWQHGELFFAYDGAPVEGGRRLALCRVMQVPFVEFTARLRMADYHKLGFSYAMANGLRPPSGRTALEIWEDWHTNPESLWLLRFVVERIFEQGRKEQDTVQIAERPPDARTFGPTN